MNTSELQPLKLLEVVLRKIFCSKTLFILGAGVSSRYIKPDYKNYFKAREKLRREFLSYPLETPSEINTQREKEVDKSRLEIALSQHIVHSTYDKLYIDGTEKDFFDEVIFSNPQLLELTCAEAYSLDRFPNQAPEYQLFNLANPNSLIVNLNHDGLAEHFIKGKRLISLHGTITPQVKRVIKEILPYSLDKDVGKLLKGLHLAAKESEKELLFKKEYQEFEEQLKHNRFLYIVIIGYSFFRKNSSDIYDGVTYDLIRTYLYENGSFCKVIIIDPEPYFVADILMKTLRTINMECFEIYWSSFAFAFKKLNQYRLVFQKTTSIYSREDLKRFSVFYDFYSYHAGNFTKCPYFLLRKPYR